MGVADMLILAGLMGMMLVGATAFIGLNDAEDEAEGATQDDANLNDSGEIIAGGGLADLLSGGQGDDQIAGYDGADKIAGAQGNDQLFGQDGRDSITGDAGADRAWGGDGADNLDGGHGDDTLHGMLGNDDLFGGTGDDSAHGGMGADLVQGGDGNDALHGGHGGDTLIGGLGEDTLFGGYGNDLISGLTAQVAQDGSIAEGDIDTADYLNGGDGADTIFAGNNDIVTAGAGADQIILGDWIVEGEEAELMDFEPGEDSLLVIFDDAAGDAPDVEIVSVGGIVHHVVVGGTLYASVTCPGEVSVDDVIVIGQSALSAPGALT